MELALEEVDLPESKLEALPTLEALLIAAFAALVEAALYF
jgi:hypothetical protein